MSPGEAFARAFLAPEGQEVVFSQDPCEDREFSIISTESFLRFYKHTTKKKRAFSSPPPAERFIAIIAHLLIPIATAGAGGAAVEKSFKKQRL